MEKISFYGVKKTSDNSVEASGTIDHNQSANDSLGNFSGNFSGLLAEGNSELENISFSDIRLDIFDKSFNNSENNTVNNGVNKRPSRSNKDKGLNYDEGHSDIYEESEGNNPYVPNTKKQKTSGNILQCSTPKEKRGPGRPPGAKNKSSTRKLGKKKCVKNPANIVTVDDQENILSKLVIDNFKRNDGYLNSETGCTSPVKKNKSEKKIKESC